MRKRKKRSQKCMDNPIGNSPKNKYTIGKDKQKIRLEEIILKLRNVRLTLGNIAPTTNAKTLIANEASEIRQKNEDGTMGAVIGYSVTCTSRRDTITVKFPLEVKPQWENLKKLLEDDYLVSIGFEGLELRLYALKTATGEIISGVSAKASAFQIESNTKDEDEILDDLEIM